MGYIKIKIDPKQGNRLHITQELDMGQEDEQAQAAQQAFIKLIIAHTGDTDIAHKLAMASSFHYRLTQAIYDLAKGGAPGNDGD